MPSFLYLQNEEKHHTHRFFHGSKFEELVAMLSTAGAIHSYIKENKQTL